MWCCGRRELRLQLAHVAERDPQLHAFLVLAAVTGARRAQLLGLRWHNVHHATCRVPFCVGWVEGPHGPVLAATKTKRRHVVDLDPDSFAVLAAESSFRRSMLMFDGDATGFLTRPISGTIIAFIALMITVPVLKRTLGRQVPHKAFPSPETDEVDEVDEEAGMRSPY